MIGRRKRKYTRRRAPIDQPEINHWELGPEIKRAIGIVALFTVALLGLISLFDGAGTLGQYLKNGLGQLFGWTDWLFLLLLLGLGFSLLLSNHWRLKKVYYLGLIIFYISLSGLLDYFVHGLSLTEIREAHSGAGIIGYGIGHTAIHYTGFWGGLLILLSLFVIAIIILFSNSLRQLGGLFSNLSGGTAYDDEQIVEEEARPSSAILNLDDEEGEETEEEILDEAPKSKQKTTEEETVKTVHRPVKRVDIPMDLLSTATNQPISGDIKAKSARIHKTLETFGIEVTMGDVNVGPTVTQFTLKPAEGVKLSQITTLQNDIALALAAHPIRIEAPIPGKSLIGIEVPNQTPSMVRLREILGSEVYQTRKSNLMVALGKDVSGKANMADLGKMPHLLIAGATGSGKSVAINSIIMSLLWQNSPSDMKLIMVDPKRVELSMYNDIPHLMTPVITDAKATINALRWVVNEMDQRYKLLASAGKRNIDSYNSSVLVNRLPYLIVVIDELADLMAVAAKEVEAAIIRLAQMARAVGIHLILATQRPSVNVITGLIKANITSRIAFSVASQMDSRTILDTSGAEKLLGNGDMLFTSASLSKPMRLQGAYISEKEVAAIVDFLRQSGEPEYDLSITENQTNGNGPGGGGAIDGDEEDLRRAAEIIIKAGKASATMLQSRMRIGYAKADRLIMQLEDMSIIGPANGSKAREILITEDQLDGAFGYNAAINNPKPSNTIPTSTPPPVDNDDEDDTLPLEADDESEDLDDTDEETSETERF
jgi:S-DNA-T family DNA segregation ATPase FtsK/SpoIIIE